MYDAVIIGAGPGGYDCAKEFLKLGGKVALVEKSFVGGTCTNRGCIPTKALIHSMEVLESIKSANRQGIKVDGYSFDFSRLMARKDRIVGGIVRAIQGNLKNQENIDFFEGEGEILSIGQVKVADKILKTKNIVIATGSVPNKIFSGENVITSDDILFSKEVPENLVIIGAGVIGLELAMVFKTLGSKITVLEALPRCLITADSEISKEMTTVLKRKGIKLITNAFGKYEGGKLILDGKEIPADKILLATGRKASLPKDLDKLGIKYDNIIETNEYQETSQKGIYALGDCSYPIQLAHVASTQGRIIAENIMKGEKNKMNPYLIPYCIYTDPEIASVGFSEDDIKEGKTPYKEDELKIYRANFAANSKAKCADALHGFIKIISQASTGKLLGVHIMGAHATDMITASAIALKAGFTISDLKEVIYPHPTLSEIMLEALDS